MKKKNFTLIIIVILSFLSIACSDNKINKVSEDEKEIENDIIEYVDDIEIENEFINMGFKRGNILKVATPSLEGNFNPVAYDSVYDSWISEMVFDSLIDFDENGLANDNGLAESFEISEDKTIYTFYLKKGVKFHDGKEFTAKDVEFTYYTLADPYYDFSRNSEIFDIIGVKEYISGEIDKISGINVIDDYTISFRIKEPNVKKINEFAYGIMPMHYYSFKNFEEFKLLLDKPMGTGIMKFKRYIKGKSVELIKNEDYFTDKAKVDGVEVELIPIESHVFTLTSGEVDICNPEANLINYEIMKNSKIVNIQEFIDNSFRCIGFNLRLEKFSDRNIRKALAYALRLDDFVETQWKGFARPSYSPISPISWAAPDLTELNKYEYDVEKAKKILRDAGWEKNADGKLMKNNEEFIITWTTYKEAEWSLNLLNTAKNNWGELGIEVIPNVMEFDEVINEVFDKQNFEVFNMRWSLSSDPDPYELFYSGNDEYGKFNSVGFHNDKADKIILDARKEYDKEKRVELYQEWAKLANDELPYIYVSIGTTIWGVNNRVKNIKLGPYSDWVFNLDKIELEY
ncbi:ABC transporter substrate-binding protein [Clostridiaceae bacterium HSG29]|nr:ABC transporter substrate-binding protein [Clostridiaceae bacterium HSG29]